MRKADLPLLGAGDSPGADNHTGNTGMWRVLLYNITAIRSPGPRTTGR